MQQVDIGALQRDDGHAQGEREQIEGRERGVFFQLSQAGDRAGQIERVVDGGKAAARDQLVQPLIDRGGEFGEFEPRAVGTLDAIGRWMDQHARSVYGAGPATYVPPPDTRYTQRGDRLYLHLFAWPFRHVHLQGLGGRVQFAQFLHDGSEIPAEVIDPGAQAQNTTMSGLGPDVLTLTLPVRQPDVAVPVVELFLEPQR